MEARDVKELPFAVTELWAENYRGFDRLHFRPNPSMTVLVGVNGSGKSSVLRLLSMPLSSLAGKLTRQWDQMRQHSDIGYVRQTDIKSDRAYGGAVVCLLAKDFEYEYASGSNRPDTPVWTPYWAQEFEAERLRGRNLLPIIEAHETIYKMAFGDPSAVVPVSSLYGVSRAVGEPSLDPLESFAERRSAYENAFDGASTFSGFFGWFRSREDLENENRVDDRSYDDHQLNTVRSAIQRFLPGFTNLRVRRNPLRMTVTKDGQELLLDQLSDGEKTLLTMVGDIARRMAVANPLMDDPLRSPGVILIDEIELHLHPAWQRRVVEQLPKTFPNVQFFLTTHSPIVANSAPLGSLFALRDGNIRQVDAYGQDVSVVLGDIFGTEPRPKAIQDDIDRLFRLIEEDSPEVDGIYNRLQHELPPQDDVLVRAQMRIRWRRR